MSVQLTHADNPLVDGPSVGTLTPARAATHGVRIEVEEVSRRVRVRNRGEVTLLDTVSFTLSPGELVAIVGPSGAGKTTLLEAMAGITPATSGSVRFDGIDVYDNLKTFRSVLGYVPQDDIIHADLPLHRTLRYAARLRLASSTAAADVDDVVRDAIDAVGLTDHANVRVGSLSGGQRKRASIAVELLTDPHEGPAAAEAVRPVMDRGPEVSGASPVAAVVEQQAEGRSAVKQATLLQRCQLVKAAHGKDGRGHPPAPRLARDELVSQSEQGIRRQGGHDPYEEIATHEQRETPPSATPGAWHRPHVEGGDRRDGRQHHRRHHQRPHPDEGPESQAHRARPVAHVVVLERGDVVGALDITSDERTGRRFIEGALTSVEHTGVADLVLEHRLGVGPVHPRRRHPPCELLRRRGKPAVTGRRRRGADRNERQDALGGVEREELRKGPTGRDADDVGGSQSVGIEHASSVGNQVRAVVRRVARWVRDRPTGVAVVVTDHEPLAVGEHDR